MEQSLLEMALNWSAAQSALNAAKGTPVDAAVGVKRELMKVPAGGEELLFSRFIRKKKEIFEFPEADRARRSSPASGLKTRKALRGPGGRC
jgi:hypothetical protein